MKIAIIGAGLSGLVLANRIAKKHEVCLFEKSRGVSGRMTTRYADPYQFDHGAQYFTARDESFQSFLKPYIDRGLVTNWQPKVVTLSPGEKPYKRDWFEPHYVAAPKMNALAKELASGLDINLKVEIRSLERKEDWWLMDKDGQSYGPFDWVVCTAPAAQAYQLMPDEFTSKEQIASVRMTGCYSILLGFEAPLAINWQAAVVKDSPIGWMALNSTKPGRDTSYSLLVQSTNDWAEEHINDDVQEAQAVLVEAIRRLIPDLPEADYLSVHRWRYADTPDPLGEDYLLDTNNQLAVCGDWCLGGRIESAFLSANRLGDVLLKE